MRQPEFFGHASSAYGLKSTFPSAPFLTWHHLPWRTHLQRPLSAAAIKEDVLHDKPLDWLRNEISTDMNKVGTSVGTSTSAGNDIDTYTGMGRTVRTKAWPRMLAWAYGDLGSHTRNANTVTLQCGVHFGPTGSSNAATSLPLASHLSTRCAEIGQHKSSS